MHRQTALDKSEWSPVNVKLEMGGRFVVRFLPDCVSAHRGSKFCRVRMDQALRCGPFCCLLLTGAYVCPTLESKFRLNGSRNKLDMQMRLLGIKLTRLPSNAPVQALQTRGMTTDKVKFFLNDGRVRCIDVVCVDRSIGECFHQSLMSLTAYPRFHWLGTPFPTRTLLPSRCLAVFEVTQEDP